LPAQDFQGAHLTIRNVRSARLGGLVHNYRMSSVKLEDPQAHLAAIRAVVAALRVGHVVTYGWVAARAGLPGRARLVGHALRTASESAKLPWHRVVGAGGRIAFAAGSALAARQTCLLRAEGIRVNGQRVEMPVATDLDAFLWGVPGTGKMHSVKKGGNP